MSIFIVADTGILSSCPNREGFSPENMMPVNQDVSPWQKEEQAAYYKGDDLFEYINGGAEIFHEYGFKQVVTQSYVFKEESIVVDIYEMKNSNAAFGIYSVQRDFNMPALGVGTDGNIYDYHAAFWQDRFYVIISGYQANEITRNAFRQFAEAVSKKMDRSSSVPELINSLPEQNRLSRSEGYLSGLLSLNTQFYLSSKNILGINGESIEGVFSTYAKGSDKAHLILISYPDSLEAKNRAKRVTDVFSERYTQVPDEEFSIFMDKKNRYQSVMTNSRLLYIVFRSGSIELLKDILK